MRQLVHYQVNSGVIPCWFKLYVRVTWALRCLSRVDYVFVHCITPRYITLQRPIVDVRLQSRLLTTSKNNTERALNSEYLLTESDVFNYENFVRLLRYFWSNACNLTSFVTLGATIIKIIMECMNDLKEKYYKGRIITEHARTRTHIHRIH